MNNTNETIQFTASTEYDKLDSQYNYIVHRLLQQDDEHTKLVIDIDNPLKTSYLLELHVVSSGKKYQGIIIGDHYAFENTKIKEGDMLELKLNRFPNYSNIEVMRSKLGDFQSPKKDGKKCTDNMDFKFIIGEQRDSLP